MPRFLRVRPRQAARAIAWLVLGAASAASGASGDSPLPLRVAGPTAIGIEYVLLDRAARIPVEAATFAEAGLTGVKHYCEHVQWGAMQRSSGAAIDFARMDDYVRHYQAAGFGRLTLCLRSHSRWASRTYRGLHAADPSPKPEHRNAYAAWVGAVVERYDHDGKADMPGLLRPVDLIEIGSELSSYEPGPIERYLDTLALAYRAAHAASESVQVAHAALLVTPVFGRHPIERSVAGYRAAFAEVIGRTNPHHGYDEVGRLLDRSDLFDVVNLHNLGDPYEIESMLEWIGFEMQRRGWRKPILISDTVATPFIAWGPATECTDRPDRLGVVIPPAREEDRCRLADFFRRLTRGDDATLRWAHRFVAADTVQRAIIAAEQGVVAIHLAFNIDLPGLTWPIARAGAGLSAWAGAVAYRGDRVVERRAMYFALRQAMTMLRGYRSVRRLSHADADLRLYEIGFGTRHVKVAWLRPQGLVLPGDPVPARRVSIPWSGQAAQVLALAVAETAAVADRVVAREGAIELELGGEPVWIVPDPP